MYCPVQGCNTIAVAALQRVNEPVSGDGTKTPEGRAELIDPVTTAAAIKSLPALLRVFAALWSPVLLQIAQMAGSRNNESQADKDGAFLTDDPES